jgi:aryl-alcohol dehydrogenase-like predicted oxidoreductase
MSPPQTRDHRDQNYDHVRNPGIVDEKRSGKKAVIPTIELIERSWAIGGAMWGGTNDVVSIKTIQHAVDVGINLIDTAPVYGFGHSEEIVGKALADGGRREKTVLATKMGLEWEDGKVYRNSSPARIRKEIEDSLRRLRTDRIDIYQVHWPDSTAPIEETAETLLGLQREGKVLALGVSNFSSQLMEAWRRVAPLHCMQPPYNIFEREIESDVLPYALKTSSSCSLTGQFAEDCFRAK